MTERILYKEKCSEDSDNCIIVSSIVSLNLDLLYYLEITNISGSCLSVDWEFVSPVYLRHEIRMQGKEELNF